MTTSEAERAEIQKERAYRRGVHQALAWVYAATEHAPSVEAARELIGRAEDLAQSFRNERYPEGAGCLLDCIGEAIALPRPQPRP